MRGLEVEISFFFFWKNDDPQWNPPCLRLHLIDRRKNPPEKLPAPFYPPWESIRSWTRIPRNLVPEESPTQYFSKEKFQCLSIGFVFYTRVKIFSEIFSLVVDTTKTAIIHIYMHFLSFFLTDLLYRLLIKLFLIFNCYLYLNNKYNLI